ncbi:MAG: hypothetical protein RML12_04585 [Xanthomonadales bacterium]|nr:hypothetical protein [Xanthomonadales bacterium]
MFRRLIAGLVGAGAGALALFFATAQRAEAAPTGGEGALAERWRAVALRVIVPRYEWAREAVLAGHREAASARTPWGREIAARAAGRATMRLRLAAGEAGSRVAALGWPSPSGITLELRRAQTLPASFQWFDATLALSPGSGDRLELTTIVAHQRFAAHEFGLGPAMHGAEDGRRGGVERGVAESAHGYGVRLAYRRGLADGRELGLHAQSRIDMEAFKNFRGVYSDAGDFDLPAAVGVTLRSELLPGVALSLRAERVFFSGVRPFTSAALPVRLLALLGDASAPRFAWQDLNLVAAELRLAAADGGQWRLAVSSRQIPLPSAPVLREALAAEAPSYHLRLGYERDLGPWGRFAALFGYAPRQGFPALGPFQNRVDPARRQRELDLVWSLGF